MNEKILRVLTEAADVGEENDPRPPEFSDEALALRFADEHKDDLRYVAIWGRWLSWDGKRWQFDDTLSAFDSARKISAEPPPSATSPALRRKSRARRPSPRSPLSPGLTGRLPPGPTSGTRTRGC